MDFSREEHLKHHISTVHGGKENSNHEDIVMKKEPLEDDDDNQPDLFSENLDYDNPDIKREIKEDEDDDIFNDDGNDIQEKTDKCEHCNKYFAGMKALRYEFT